MVDYDPVLGAYSLDIPWVPTPTEIVRRATILDAVDSCKPGHVLEIGCGGGALIYDLARKNFSGKGVDSSTSALDVARSLNESCKSKFLFASEIAEQDAESYDYVIAISVLEHIEDDHNAVRQWRNCLRPNGKLIIGVPAHKRLWGLNDEKAGHYRRYERSDLLSLMNDTGFSIREMFSYGYPALNIMKRLSNLVLKLRMLRKRKGSVQPTISDATAQSGIDRPIWQKMFGIYSSSVFRILWKGLIFLQSKFYRSDKGTGYVLVAEKSRSEFGCLLAVGLWPELFWQVDMLLLLQ